MVYGKQLKKERQDMQLNRAGLANKNDWEAKGYTLPTFAYETVKNNTKENPF